MNKSESVKKSDKKKKRNESLLVKYGVVAFFEILVFISVFLGYTTHSIKAPIKVSYIFYSPEYLYYTFRTWQK